MRTNLIPELSAKSFLSIGKNFAQYGLLVSLTLWWQSLLCPSPACFKCFGRSVFTVQITRNEMFVKNKTEGYLQSTRLCCIDSGKHKNSIEFILGLGQVLPVMVAPVTDSKT